MSCLTKEHILEIEDLSISFLQYGKGLRQIELPVISKLNVSVHKGEIVAIVGSSGSGKSLLAHAVLGLLPSNANVRGSIYFNDELMTMKRLTEVRGKSIALVPQSVNYLDPLMKVGAQIRKNKKDKDANGKMLGLLKRYHLKEKTANLYPFELSGGDGQASIIIFSTYGKPGANYC